MKKKKISKETKSGKYSRNSLSGTDLFGILRDLFGLVWFDACGTESLSVVTIGFNTNFSFLFEISLSFLEFFFKKMEN